MISKELNPNPHHSIHILKPAPFSYNKINCDLAFDLFMKNYDTLSYVFVFFSAFMKFDDPRAIFLDRSSAWNFFKNPYTLLGGHFSDPVIEKSELIFFSKRLVVFSFILAS